MNIGLLEDIPDIVECLTVALQARGHSIDAHTTGKSLLQALSACETGATPTCPYQLVIIDLGLPGGMSGLEVLSHLHAYVLPRVNLPIVVLSSASDGELAQVRDRFPATLVIRKPYRLQELYRTIEEAAPDASPKPSV